MIAVENILFAALTVFAFALAVISLLAWRLARDSHLLFLGAAFVVFFVKGLFLTLALSSAGPYLSHPPILSAGFHLAVLALFYVSPPRT